MKGSKLTNAKRNSLIGFSFTIPWVIGFIFLFLIPLIKTVLYSFSSISIGKSGFELSFVGVRNYRATFSEDPNNGIDLNRQRCGYRNSGSGVQPFLGYTA